MEKVAAVIPPIYFLLAIPLLFAVSSVLPRLKYLAVVACLMVAVNIAYLLFWEENLHCDQYTSLYTAFFDFEPHAEEIPIPPVYHAVGGVAIRLLYALLYFAIAFATPVIVFKNKTAFVYSKQPLIIVACIATGVLAWLIPESIAGERLTAYVRLAVILNIALVLLFLTFLAANTFIRGMIK